MKIKKNNTRISSDKKTVVSVTVVETEKPILPAKHVTSDSIKDMLRKGSSIEK